MKKLLILLTVTIISIASFSSQTIKADYYQEYGYNYHRSSFFWDTPDPFEEHWVQYSADDPYTEEGWTVGEPEKIIIPVANYAGNFSGDTETDLYLNIGESTWLRAGYYREEPGQDYSFLSMIVWFDEDYTFQEVTLLYEIYDVEPYGDDELQGWSDAFQLEDGPHAFFQIRVVTMNPTSSARTNESADLADNVSLVLDISAEGPSVPDYDEGFNSIRDLFSTLASALFSIEILPGIPLGAIIGIPIGVSVFWFALRFLRG